MSPESMSLVEKGPKMQGILDTVVPLSVGFGPIRPQQTERDTHGQNQSSSVMVILY